MTLRDDHDEPRHTEANERASRMAEYGRRADALLKSMETPFLTVAAEFQSESTPLTTEGQDGVITAVYSVDGPNFHQLLMAYIEQQHHFNPSAYKYLFINLVQPVMVELMDEASKKGWLG